MCCFYSWLGVSRFIDIERFLFYQDTLSYLPRKSHPWMYIFGSFSRDKDQYKPKQINNKQNRKFLDTFQDLTSVDKKRSNLFVEKRVRRTIYYRLTDLGTILNYFKNECQLVDKLNRLGRTREQTGTGLILLLNLKRRYLGVLSNGLSKMKWNFGSVISMIFM